MINCSVGLRLVLVTSPVGFFAPVCPWVLIVEAGVGVLDRHGLISLRALAALVRYQTSTCVSEAIN